MLLDNNKELTLTQDQADCYQELANVAMGQAADNLAKRLNVFVILPIPKVSIIELSDLQMTLADADQGKDMSAVCQGFAGAGLCGEALLIFNNICFDDLARLMANSNKYQVQMQESELLMDMSSLLIGAFLKGFGEQLDLTFNQGNPQILGQHCPISELLKAGHNQWKKTFAIDIHYQIENTRVNCDLVILFTQDSVIKLNEKTRCLWED